jgi:hypothetical protein
MKRHYIFFLILFTILGVNSIAQNLGTGVQGGHKNAYTKVEPPSLYKDRVVLGKTAATSYFQVTYSDSGSKQFTVPEKEAFDHAVDIWGHLLNVNNPNRPIKILARLKDLGYSSHAGYTLAECTPASYYNSSNLPNPNTQYPVALAEALLDQNLNGNNYDMIVTVNSDDSVNWYFGTDGVPEKDKIDFVSTILHEIAHGLGFTSSFNVQGNIGTKGFDSVQVDPGKHPTIYDKFTSITDDYPPLYYLTSYNDMSTTLKNKLTSDNVYFSGDNAWVENGHTLPKLYAPTTWVNGSSITHLDGYKGQKELVFHFGFKKKYHLK